MHLGYKTMTLDFFLKLYKEHYYDLMASGRKEIFITLPHHYQVLHVLVCSTQHCKADLKI